MASKTEPQRSLLTAEPTAHSVWCRLLLASEVPALERGPLLQRLGIPEEELVRRGGRVTHRASNALWAQLTDGHPDPIFGIHFAQHAEASELGIAGYLAMASSSGLAALERVMRYHQLIKSDSESECRVTPRHVHVVEDPGAGRPRWPRHLAEALMFSYLGALRRWSSAEITAVRVSFQHDAGGAASAVEHAFGCPAYFGKPKHELVLPREALEAPLRTQDPVLLAYLEELAGRMLQELPRAPSLLVSARRAIAETLPSGEVSIERVAKKLGMGPRTLQRRLRELDLSFSDVLEGVRRDAYERLLKDRQHNMTEVAFLLGFSDSSGFRRASRRWRGTAQRGAVA